ncbi:LiaF transmembrane domain-containing protein [Bacillus rubiinfantis]|uniref:LiaF transmembrane domain-containing protein n=1 Tax=Bacillus rubiinfantis TaxID=1499680 RepID=UPI0005A7C99C|nr:DUF5668 domain-containing protein [Bacillus rubiinfantis]
MKSQRIFSGIILIGFGAYYLLQQAGITLILQLPVWNVLLIIIGFACLGQGYLANDAEFILPGVIMFAFGVHFQLASKLDFWPDNHMGIMLFIISIGFFLRFQRTNSSLSPAFLFLIISVILLFYDQIGSYFGILQSSASFVWKFWPVLLIVVGIYFILKRKK